MNYYLGIVDFTNLVYFLEAKNEKEAKLKIRDEVNKMKNQILMDMPLKNIHVSKSDVFVKRLEKSEDKIIEIKTCTLWSEE